jgi:cytochrome c-type biogenesis protein CcmH/NrfG
LGEVYLRSQAWPRAEVAFRRSIEIDPEVVGGWEGLARALTAKGALGEAVRTYRQALEIRPGWWPYYEALRDLYRELNMASEAGESERQMAALFDSVPNAGRYWWVEHMSRGVQLQAKGSLSAAAREFARAAHFLPDKPAMEMLQRLEE